MTKEEFVIEVEKLGIKLTDEQIRQFETYCDFLLEKNKVVNLTAIKDEEGVYLKHFYDCITIFKSGVIKPSSKVLDIGSGAGFPGIVIKIIEPSINITILDSSMKKINFIAELTTYLNIKDIHFVDKRSEEYFPLVHDEFDIVTARAVANLNTLSELAIPFVKENGYFLSMKGKYTKELEEARDAITILGGEIEDIISFKLPKELSERAIIKIKKISKTPSIYPRRYDKIIKYPLKKVSK